MEQYSRIISEIQRKIQDESYQEDVELKGFINDGLREIAAEVVLPELLTYTTVTCLPDQFTIAMPDDYFANLIWARNVTKDRMVYTYGSLTIFLERYASGWEGLRMTGDVRAVCCHGRQLYYALQPVTGGSQDVRLWYAQQPTLIDTGTEDISYIPEQLQARLLVNYACMRVFEEIEEDERQPQTEKYYRKFSEAKAALINFVGLPERPPDFIPNYNDPWTATGSILHDSGAGDI